ncbi:unnamed protein product [Leptosia nina]|uniref:Uncharacterized protein n=1 Tax=Leptosia nina TaxID=320188 RepID=A0AAV1J4L1_9NEOP
MSQDPVYNVEDAEKHFEEFMTAHDKKYESDSEKFQRLLIFTSNLHEVNKKNAESRGAVYGINKFSDLTKEEFLKYYTGFKPGTKEPKCAVSISERNSSITAPDAFDWRSKNVVSRVKDQKMCGSCWAFGASGAVESEYAIKYKKIQEISEQQLVDCDKRSEGCSGSTELEFPFYHFIENGAMSEEDYPYEAKDASCKYDTSKVKIKLEGCRNLDVKNNEDKLKDLLHEYGPATIAIDASALSGYTSGVVLADDCESDTVNHAVLLVGYGTEKDVPFWIIKNSWGESWGEKGYFRMQRGINCLNIQASKPVQAIIA